MNELGEEVLQKKRSREELLSQDRANEQ